MSILKQTFKNPDNIKTVINIGALLDVPTGFYIRGINGENILLGGLGQITAVVGRGNRFKSTILHYMMLSAADRISSTTDTSMSTYDTEINIHEEALKRYISRFPNLKDKNIIGDGTWLITDKTIYYANKWFEELKVFFKLKHDNLKDLMVSTPFIDRSGKEAVKIITPTFSEVDSFSEFETEDVAEIQTKNELGDSGANTIHMRQGLSKTRFLMEIPTIVGRVNHFMLMTAHLDDSIQVAQGPYTPAPVKKLQHLKAGDSVKGVTGKFFFLMNNCWHASSSVPLINQSTKGPEYPKQGEEIVENDKDLNIIALVQLRGKAGPSGYALKLIVSQTEGVLPTLSEFHYIKTTDRFGLSGSLQHYALDIYPEVKLSRTTVRNKIDSDLKLQRAINITSELLQIRKYYRTLAEYFCTPKELYDGIKEQGYDWDMILSETRGWWAPNDKDNPLRFLSTLDLMKMRKGEYTPYWYKKVIKND